MRVLFDTSVLVAATVEPHPVHNRALPWLQRAKAGEFDFLVATHTLAELYAVLTTLPVKPRITPLTAWRLVQTNVGGSARIVSLSVSDYKGTVRGMAENGLTGGVIYDALIVTAARKSGADRLLTFNEHDFLCLWPQGEDVITVP